MWKGLCGMNPTAAGQRFFCLTDLGDAANHTVLVRLEIMSKRDGTLAFHKNGQTM